MSFTSAAKTTKGSEGPAPAPAAREAGRGVTPPLLVAAGGVAQCANACFEPRLAPLPPGAQAKLVVGAVDDPLEREADTLAERLLRMPDKGALAPLPAPSAVEGPRLRRKCTTCALDEERIQRKADGGSSGGGLTPASHVRAATASGQPLPASARAYFEPRLGRDLSGVRVHTGPAAAASARAVGARAYTLGSDIVFARGHFSPESQEGRRLLAHELAHTLQQGGAPGVLRRQPDGGTASDAGANPAPQTATPGPAPTVVPGATVPPPPPTPKGPTTVYNGITLADDEAFLRYQMEQYIADNGPAAARSLLAGLWGELQKNPVLIASAEMASPGVTSLPGGVPPTVDELAAKVDAAEATRLRSAFTLRKVLDTLDSENEEFIKDFKSKAIEATRQILTESETRVKQEAVRYGLRTEWVDSITAVSGPMGAVAIVPTKEAQHHMQVSGSTKGLAIAAQGIEKRQKSLAEATGARDSLARFLNQAVHPPHGEQPTISHQIRLRELNAEVSQKQRDLDVFRTQMQTSYPILAAVADDPAQLARVASGPSDTTASVLTQQVGEKLFNIKQVREGLANGDVNIWRVDRVIGATTQIMGVTPGSMRARILQEKVDAEKPGILGALMLGVLQFGLVLLAPATGGLSLIPAAAISVATAYHSVKDYLLQSAMAGTDFNRRAAALSAEEPSLFWVALDIVGAALDLGAAAGAAKNILRRLAPYARALREAGRDAAKVSKATKELTDTARGFSEDLAQRLARSAEREAAVHGGQSVGATADELKALREAGAIAEQEIAKGAKAASTIGGGEVKVAGSGIWTCSSPCTQLRERFSRILAENASLEGELAQLEARASKAPAGAAGDAERQAIANAAADLENKIRRTPTGNWRSPLADAPEYEGLVKRRGSVGPELDTRPANWSGKDEAAFKGRPSAEEGYHWHLEDTGQLSYRRNRVEVGGVEIPERTFVELPPPGHFDNIDPSIIPPQFLGEKKTFQMGADQQAHFEKLLKDREAARMQRDVLEAIPEAQRTQDQLKQLADLRARVNEQSRLLGESAATQLIKTSPEFKGATLMYPPAGAGSRAGDFDQVWRIPGKTPAEDVFIVLEAKGGSSTLGSRVVEGGARASQGSRPYFDSIVQNMLGIPEGRNTAVSLRNAAANGRVRYMEVRAPVSEATSTAAAAPVKVPSASGTGFTGIPQLEFREFNITAPPP